VPWWESSSPHKPTNIDIRETTSETVKDEVWVNLNDLMEPPQAESDDGDQEYEDMEVVDLTKAVEDGRVKY